MGNSIARDFAKVSLGHGSVPSSFEKELIAPGSVVLDQPMTVLLRRDHSRKSTIVFDGESMMPLLITESKRRKKSSSSSSSSAPLDSVTKDRRGHKLFLTTAPSKNERLIYKAPKTAAPVAVGDQSSLDNLDSSNHSSSSYCSLSSTRSSASRYADSDVPATAKIEIDHSGAVVTAFFSVVVWKGSGPEMMQVYKAVKVPTVKYGALVADNSGQVVAKSKLDESRMEPTIQVAAGADVPAVVATITALFGEF